MDQRSPFRTAPLACPRCRTTHLGSGALRRCEGCRGAWVPDDALHERISEMQASLPRLDWRVVPTRLALPCPHCRHAMEALALFGVPVDRCRSHGVWFDGGELAEVLRRSAEARADAPPRSEVATAVAVDAGAAGVDGGIGNAANDLGALEVIGGILEVLGDIFSAIDL